MFGTKGFEADVLLHVVSGSSGVDRGGSTQSFSGDDNGGYSVLRHGRNLVLIQLLISLPTGRIDVHCFSRGCGLLLRGVEPVHEAVGDEVDKAASKIAPTWARDASAKIPSIHWRHHLPEAVPNRIIANTLTREKRLHIHI